MARQILVPLDGSPKSMEGLEYAVSTYGAESITVLHVLTPHAVWHGDDEPSPEEMDDGEVAGDVGDATDGPAPGSSGEDWYETARAAADEIFDDARDLAADHGVEIDTVTEIGEPWRVIVDYADENDVDHVIMGSHGRRDDTPVPLGSVAETVMRRSPVLVSVVR